MGFRTVCLLLDDPSADDLVRGVAFPSSAVLRSKEEREEQEECEKPEECWFLESQKAEQPQKTEHSEPV
jgi:hypothetical protein